MSLNNVTRAAFTTRTAGFSNESVEIDRFGWEAGIRTPITASRAPCPTVERPPSNRPRNSAGQEPLIVSAASRYRQGVGGGCRRERATARNNPSPFTTLARSLERAGEQIGRLAAAGLSDE